MLNVKVAVRIRPLSQREVNLEDEIVVQKKDNFVVITNPKNQRQRNGASQKNYKFFVDFCFDSNPIDVSSQENVYKEIGVPVIKSMFDGYNVCILAYGHSASGKTYTMMGVPSDLGLTPRICLGLFDFLDSKPKIQFEVAVSFLEIYNEKVRDLLKENEKGDSKKFSLRVREHPKLGPYVQDLSKHIVTKRAELLELLSMGNKRRTTASTQNNANSSRSHAVFTFCLRQTDSENYLVDKYSKVHLVDLAGSERANGDQNKAKLKEGANINKSLVTLGNVISALAGKSDARSAKVRFTTKFWQPYVPYRDSVLTWLLKDSLGGNSNTILIATVSPASSCFTETINTLKYARRAKRIMNSPVINEDPKSQIIRKLKEEIIRLRFKLLSEGRKDLNEMDADIERIPTGSEWNDVEVFEIQKDQKFNGLNSYDAFQSDDCAKQIKRQINLEISVKNADEIKKEKKFNVNKTVFQSRRLGDLEDTSEGLESTTAVSLNVKSPKNLTGTDFLEKNDKHSENNKHKYFIFHKEASKVPKISPKKGESCEQFTSYLNLLKKFTTFKVVYNSQPDLFEARILLFKKPLIFEGSPRNLNVSNSNYFKNKKLLKSSRKMNVITYNLALAAINYRSVKKKKIMKILKNPNKMSDIIKAIAKQLMGAQSNENFQRADSKFSESKNCKIECAPKQMNFGGNIKIELFGLKKKPVTATKRQKTIKSNFKLDTKKNGLYVKKLSALRGAAVDLKCLNSDEDRRRNVLFNINKPIFLCKKAKVLGTPSKKPCSQSVQSKLIKRGSSETSEYYSPFGRNKIFSLELTKRKTADYSMDYGFDRENLTSEYLVENNKEEKIILDQKQASLNRKNNVDLNLEFFEKKFLTTKPIYGGKNFKTLLPKIPPKIPVGEHFRHKNTSIPRSYSKANCRRNLIKSLFLSLTGIFTPESENQLCINRFLHNAKRLKNKASSENKSAFWYEPELGKERIINLQATDNYVMNFMSGPSEKSDFGKFLVRGIHLSPDTFAILHHRRDQKVEREFSSSPRLFYADVGNEEKLNSWSTAKNCENVKEQNILNVQKWLKGIKSLQSIHICRFEKYFDNLIHKSKDIYLGSHRPNEVLEDLNNSQSCLLGLIKQNVPIDILFEKLNDDEFIKLELEIDNLCKIFREILNHQNQLLKIIFLNTFNRFPFSSLKFHIEDSPNKKRLKKKEIPRLLFDPNESLTFVLEESTITKTNGPLKATAKIFSKRLRESSQNANEDTKCKEINCDRISRRSSFEDADLADLFADIEQSTERVGRSKSLGHSIDEKPFNAPNVNVWELVGLGHFSGDRGGIIEENIPNHSISFARTIDRETNMEDLNSSKICIKCKTLVNRDDDLAFVRCHKISSESGNLKFKKLSRRVKSESRSRMRLLKSHLLKPVDNIYEDSRRRRKSKQSCYSIPLIPRFIKKVPDSSMTSESARVPEGRCEVESDGGRSNDLGGKSQKDHEMKIERSLKGKQKNGDPFNLVERKSWCRRKRCTRPMKCYDYEMRTFNEIGAKVSSGDINFCRPFPSSIRGFVSRRNSENSTKQDFEKIFSSNKTFKNDSKFVERLTSSTTCFRSEFLKMKCKSDWYSSWKTRNPRQRLNSAMGLEIIERDVCKNEINVDSIRCGDGDLKMKKRIPEIECVRDCKCKMKKINLCARPPLKSIRSTFELSTCGPGGDHCASFCTFCREKDRELYFSTPALNSECSAGRCRLHFYGHCPCSGVRLPDVPSGPRAYMQHLLTLRRYQIGETIQS